MSHVTHKNESNISHLSAATNSSAETPQDNMSRQVTQNILFLGGKMTLLRRTALSSVDLALWRVNMTLLRVIMALWRVHIAFLRVNVALLSEYMRCYPDNMSRRVTQSISIFEWKDYSFSTKGYLKCRYGSLEGKYDSFEGKYGSCEGKYASFEG